MCPLSNNNNQRQGENSSIPSNNAQGDPSISSQVEEQPLTTWERNNGNPLSFNLLRLNHKDRAWDIWRACQVRKGKKSAQQAMVRLCQGAYQVPHSVSCDRLFVQSPLEAHFVRLMHGHLSGMNLFWTPNPICMMMEHLGKRLPNYTPDGSGSRFREWDSFESALLFEGGRVITREDWEVAKRLSSRRAIEKMSVSDLLEKGLNLPSSLFPPTPAFLLGRTSVPAGLAIPPLWSLKFFANHVFKNGPPGSDLSLCPSVQKRLLEIVADELVVCVVLGVTAEREAFKRTPIVHVDTAFKILDYHGPDKLKTRCGSVSIKDVGARLLRARTVPVDLLIRERPLHVSCDLYFAPDELIYETSYSRAVATPRQAGQSAEGDSARVDLGQPSSNGSATRASARAFVEGQQENENLRQELAAMADRLARMSELRSTDADRISGKRRRAKFKTSDIPHPVSKRQRKD